MSADTSRSIPHSQMHFQYAPPLGFFLRSPSSFTVQRPIFCPVKSLRVAPNEASLARHPQLEVGFRFTRSERDITASFPQLHKHFHHRFPLAFGNSSTKVNLPITSPIVALLFVISTFLAL